MQLTILHLVGMLLIVAVGSNYALFFDRQANSEQAGDAALTLASLVIANASTVIGFGLLSFSQVPVLVALGTTVAPGTFLALLFAAIGASARPKRACVAFFAPPAAGTRAPTQMIWLPGAYHSAQDFLDAGFARAAAQRRVPLDLLFVDLEMRHLDDRDAFQRLRSEIVLPARDRAPRFGWRAFRWAAWLRWTMPALTQANSTDCACSRPISETAC